MKTNNALERDAFLREIIITLTECGVSPQCALTLALSLPIHKLTELNDVESRRIYCQLLSRTVLSFKNSYDNISHSYPDSFETFLLNHYGTKLSA